MYVAAYNSCVKPCTDVTYSIEAESFTAVTSNETRHISRCDWTDSPSILSLLFSRRIIWEYVSFGLSTLKFVWGKLYHFWKY